MKVIIDGREIKTFELSFIDGHITCIETIEKDVAGHIVEKIQYVDETWYDENREPEYIGESCFNKHVPENKKLCVIVDGLVIN